MLKKIIIAFLCLFIFGCVPEEKIKNKENTNNQDIFREPSGQNPKPVNASSTKPSLPIIKETRVIVPKLVVEERQPKINVSKNSGSPTTYIKIEDETKKAEENKIIQAIEESANSGKSPIIYVEKTIEKVAPMSMRLPDNSSDLKVIKWFLVGIITLLAIVTFCLVFNLVMRLKNKNIPYSKEIEEQGYFCE